MRKIVWMMLAACLLCACGGRKEGATIEEGHLRWTSLKRDTTVSLAAGANGPKAELHLIIYYIEEEGFDRLNDSLLRSGILFPDYLAQADTLRSIRAAVDYYVSRFTGDYRTDYGDMYRRDVAHGASYNVQFSCETSVKPSRRGIVNYLAQQYYFGGGQHGVEMLAVRNIDTEGRRILAFDDVFMQGSDDQLADLIAEQLCRDRKAKNVEELRQKGFFVNMDPYPSHNFILGRRSVSFVYADSEIAPHEEGIVTVEIPNDKLRHLFTEAAAD